MRENSQEVVRADPASPRMIIRQPASRAPGYKIDERADREIRSVPRDGTIDIITAGAIAGDAIEVQATQRELVQGTGQLHS